MPTLLLWPRNLLQDKVLWKTEYIGCAAHLVIGVLVGDVKYVIDPLTLNRNESIRKMKIFFTIVMMKLCLVPGNI